MGEPRYPTPSQVQDLRKATDLSAEKSEIKGGELTVVLPAHGLAVIEVR
jgi:hypothetical protein